MKHFWLVWLFCINQVSAQTMGDQIFMNSIKTPMLYIQGNQTSYPIISLGSTGLMQLDFDDLDASVKNFSYTYQLCNADWSEVNLNVFDYMSGFTQQRLTQYRRSAVSTTQYVHYQAQLPTKECMPKLSGNYLLKVFLNGDPSKLAFTKRFLIVNSRVNIGAQIMQPFNTELLRTHQKVQFSVDKTQLNVTDPRQQLKVVVMQNFRWEGAVTDIYPTFIRGNVLEFNGEIDCLFPAGRDYRWIDLRSFRFKSDRMMKNDLTTKPFSIEVIPDGSRVNQRYIFFRDLNGFFEISGSDVDNAWWQGDYAEVKFSYIPAGNIPFPDRDVFIVGKFAENAPLDSSKLQYNAEAGVYEKKLWLKQGYYTYNYATKEIKKKKAALEFNQTEGNYWETENDYTVLVYYRSFSGRHDELVGYTTVNSRTGSNFLR